MPLGNSSPVRSPTRDIELVTTLWTGNGSGDAVLAAGKGASALARTAQGKYTLTLRDIGTTFLGCHFGIRSATGASNKKFANWVAYNSTAKTITIEVSDGATPTLQDLAATDDAISITVVFSRQ